MDDVVTPPYDVIDEQAQAAFFRKTPYSMIQLDLSKNYNTDAPTGERYAAARATFDAWQRDGILVRDEQPAFYVYHTDYRIPSGKRFTRKGFVAQVGLAEFAEGVVKPHERTFPGVTSDRLKLMEACEAHFSSIFSLYADPTGEVMGLLDPGAAAPLFEVHDQDGCRHALWPVADPDALRRVSGFFADKSLYIADGHHRYTTALQYRAIMRQRRGDIAENDPWNHVMMYLCAMEDPGLSVLPTHRLLRLPHAADVDRVLECLREAFEVEEVSGGSREGLVEEALGRMVEAGSRTVFGFYHAGTDRCFLLRLLPGVMERHFASSMPRIMLDLDVVVLSELVFERLLGVAHGRLEQEKLIRYFSDPDDALDVAVKESAVPGAQSPLLFLMNGTPVSQVRDVADAGLIMPHKSTYFYPKVLTGLLMNRMAAGETI